MSSSNGKITQYEKNLVEKRGIVVMINENMAFYHKYLQFWRKAFSIYHILKIKVNVI